MFVHALPDYAYLRDIVDPAPMPQARDFAARCLSISNSPWLDEEGFEAIVAVLRRVCTESGS
nr:putative DegT/DnrJ/EryC1/strs_aminotransferase protein [Xanthomonas translucens pv. translucens DSM 18974]